MAREKKGTAVIVGGALALGALGGFFGHAAIVKEPVPVAPPAVTQAPPPPVERREPEPVCPQVEREDTPRATLADVARDWGITGRLSCSVVDIP